METWSPRLGLARTTNVKVCDATAPLDAIIQVPGLVSRSGARTTLPALPCAGPAHPDGGLAAVNIHHFIQHYGYLAVFCFVAIESLGIPIPGETALITAGIYAGGTHKLSPWLIWLVASAAAIIGDNIGYIIGDKGGYRLVRRYGPKIRIDEAKLKVGRYAFDRYGGKVVFFGRFVSVLRTYAAFLAGTNKMRWPHFFFANATGGIIWAAIYTFGAYFAGSTLSRVSGTINLALGGVAVVAIVTVFLLIRHQTNRLIAVAEEAYPGPLSD
jgi:membrane protein DedA with SNARE-associated domain